MFPGGFSAPSGLSPKSLTLISTVSAALSATVEIEIPTDTTYIDYLLLITDVKPATDNQVLKISAKQGGVYTGTLNATSTSTGAGATTVNNIQTAAPTSIHVAGARSAAATAGISGQFWIRAPDGATANKVINYSISQNALGSSEVTNGMISSSATTALTGIRFSFASGNIASGTLRLYGITRF